MSDNVHAKHVVVVSEEDVEQEQLTDGVDAVHQLDEDVATRQIVAVQSARDEDAMTRQQLAKAWETSCPLITSCHQITIQQVHGEPSNSTTVHCIYVRDMSVVIKLCL